MEILGYISAFFIGISLGLLGGGGSILTVPALVYLMRVSPLLATTSSLFIVGVTSLVGGIRAYSKNLVDFKAVTEFGMPAIFSIFITRHYILPAIPAHIFYAGNIDITRDISLMIIFAILMLLASFFMIRNNVDGNEINITADEPNTIVNNRKDRILSLFIFGLIIGVITGLLGAGGGFLIIPTLVLFMKLPMKIAVGTSLLIIAINSLFGFLFSLQQFRFDWKLLTIFTLMAIVGIFTGSRIGDKISSPSLKRGFGWFVLVMAIYILLKELVLTRPGK